MMMIAPVLLSPYFKSGGVTISIYPRFGGSLKYHSKGSILRLTVYKKSKMVVS